MLLSWLVSNTHFFCHPGVDLLIPTAAFGSRDGRQWMMIPKGYRPYALKPTNVFIVIAGQTLQTSFKCGFGGGAAGLLNKAKDPHEEGRKAPESEQVRPR